MSIPATCPAPYRAAGDIEIGAGDGEFNLASDVGQFKAKKHGQNVQGINVDGGRLLDVFGVAGVARRSPPTEFILIGVGRPQTQIDALEHPHVVHLGGHAGRHGSKVVGVTGMDPGAEQARATGQRGFMQLGTRRRTNRATGHEAGRGDDVDARPQQTGHVLEIQMQRHVEDAIGFEVDQSLDVVCRLNADRTSQPNEVADVAADFVSAEGVGANEIQTRSLQH